MTYQQKREMLVKINRLTRELNDTVDLFEDNTTYSIANNLSGCWIDLDEALQALERLERQNGLEGEYD